MGTVYVNERAIEQSTRIAAESNLNGTDLASHGNNPFSDVALHVLDYERATEVIGSAKHLGVSLCYCRHKKQHLGTACDKPLEICLSFSTTADSLIRHGHARRIDEVEANDLLQQAYDLNLVQFGENVREDPAFMCNCCGCCCEAMIGMRKFGAQMPIRSTNYIPHIITEKCTGCGHCTNICPVEAMTLVSANDPHKPRRRKAKLDEDVCLGCGICVRVCQTDALLLETRPERILTPLNTAHRVVMMAIERGNLQDVIFDNKALLSHRMMGAFLGAILKLPPLKRAMASRQVKSRYLESLLARIPASPP